MSMVATVVHSRLTTVVSLLHCVCNAMGVSQGIVYCYTPADVVDARDFWTRGQHFSLNQ